MSNLPNGYKQNSLGHLVPVESIEPLDLLRDDVVCAIYASALALQKHITSEKAWMQKQVHDFLEMAWSEYQIKLGGKERGNLTLSSFDGKTRVQLQVSDTLSFTEQLQIAKQLIDQCVLRWSEGANSHIRTLVMHAFQTDKEGKINTGRVLSLLRVSIEDEGWKNAMKALRNSFSVTSSKEYMRISRRESVDAKFEHVVLDFSSL